MSNKKNKESIRKLCRATFSTLDNAASKNKRAHTDIYRKIDG